MNFPEGYRKIRVKTWYLTFPGDLPRPSFEGSAVSAVLWKKPPVHEYLEIYKAVGEAWGWTGRLLKPTVELTELLNSDRNEVWLFKSENETAGFFELVRGEGETEIVYLGLKPEWIGKGLGQKLIGAAIAFAGRNGEKVWLHTCERDHPGALQSYLKAGFTIEKELVSLEYYPE